MAFRRGNKSNKVPNVKLRPALPGSFTKPKNDLSHDTLRHHDSGFDSEQENSFVDMRVPRPFRGVVLCATGISDKMSLFKRAIELGAQPFNDLTDRVTHLLALEPGSAKYKCALENNIVIMHPSWVEDSYEIWLKGDDVNLKESVQQHRLPIFNDVTLSLSGIEDDDQKEIIIRRVQKEGGSYAEDIKRPVKVTHLLCTSGADAPSEKMRYAAKFNRQREADIKMVWVEWFWDCLKAGGRCDEEKYTISKPRPLREITPEGASPPPRSSSPNNALNNTPGSTTASQTGNTDPDEGDEEETAVPIKVAPAVTNEIWGVLLRNRGFEARSGKLVRSPTKVKELSKITSNVEDTPTKPKQKRGYLDNAEKSGYSTEQQRSILKSLRRGQASTVQRVPSDHAPSGETTVNLLARPTIHEKRTSLPPEQQAASIAGPSSKPLGDEGPHNHNDRFFDGLTFRLLGEAKCSHVKAALEETGGRIVGDSSDDPVDFVIVRLVSGSALYREEVDEVSRAAYRTECWLERCFSERRICSADEHISFTPLKVPVNIPRIHELTVSISGLEESEACWIRRLLRALGINFAPAFSRRTTHLLCPSRTGAKHDKAQEWDIPVVEMDWLVHIATVGDVPSVLPELQSGRRGSGSESPIDKPSTDLHEPPGVDTSDSFGEAVGLLPEDEFTGDPELMSAKSTDNDPHPLTLAELREDMLNTHIPSSKTPSPIKRLTASPSPAKISREATRVLQESITTLLGKRLSTEDTSKGQAPRSKRVRPPSRAKVPAQDGDDVLPVLRPIISSREPYDPFAAGEREADMLFVDGADEDASIRVTYEDPVQNSEKQRLMKLLESQKPPDIWELGSRNTEDSGPSANPLPAAKRSRQPRRSTRSGKF